MRWKELRFASVGLFYGVFRHFTTNEPLLGDVGLDDIFTSVAVPDLMHMLLYINQKALFFEFFDDFRTSSQTLLSFELAGIVVKNPLLVKNGNELQIVTFSNFIVVWIMCRSNLDHTGTKLHIDMGICDDWYLSSYKWKCHFFTNEMLVTLILRVHHNRRIAEVGFRSRRCNDHFAASITKRIAYMIKSALLLFVLHFDVTKRSIMRTPVDHIVSANDESLVVEVHKCLFNRFLQPLIHRKTLTLPCRAYTHLSKLRRHDACRLLFPLPCTL